jgi:hypothetical protein
MKEERFLAMRRSAPLGSGSIVRKAYGLALDLLASVFAYLRTDRGALLGNEPCIGVKDDSDLILHMVFKNLRALGVGFYVKVHAWNRDKMRESVKNNFLSKVIYVYKDKNLF